MTLWSVIKLNGIKLSVIFLLLCWVSLCCSMLIDIMLSVIMLNVTVLNVIMLSVVMLNVVMLSVLAPMKQPSTVNLTDLSVTKRKVLMLLGTGLYQGRSWTPPRGQGSCPRTWRAMATWSTWFRVSTSTKRKPGINIIKTFFLLTWRGNYVS